MKLQFLDGEDRDMDDSGFREEIKTVDDLVDFEAWRKDAVQKALDAGFQIRRWDSPREHWEGFYGRSYYLGLKDGIVHWMWLRAMN